MKSKLAQKQFLLKGKVVQTFQISGEKIAKIYIEPASIDILVNADEEVNLGEIISFNVTIDDKSLKSISNSIKPLPF